nr:hypothetical protein [Deltaproteobacteria bacterium]
MNCATHVASLITSFGSILLLGGCPGPRTPSVPAATPVTLALGREGGSLRGVAGDGTRTFAAITSAASTTFEARRGDAVAWTVALPGGGGPIATVAGVLVGTLTGSGSIGVRGEPGAALVGLDVTTGAPRWRTTLDASEWCIVTAMVADPD